MAVAAAIGVGDGGDQEEGDVMSSRLANATSRLSGKRSLLRSSSGIPSSNSETLGQSQQQRVQQQGLSEINRSIEKMTLQPMNNGESSSSSFSAASASTRDIQGMVFSGLKNQKMINIMQRFRYLTVAFLVKILF